MLRVRCASPLCPATGTLLTPEQYRLALSYMGLHVYDGALAAYLKAATIDTDSVEIKTGLAQCRRLVEGQRAGVLTWDESPVLVGHAPAARLGHTAVMVGARIFYMGGFVGSEVLNDLFYIDTATMTVVTRPALAGSARPPPRASHASAAVGNKLYVFGGFDGEVSLSDLWVLNTDTLEWSEVVPVASAPPPARSAHSMVTFEGRLIVYGGHDEEDYYSEVWVFNPRTRKWSKPRVKGEAPHSRASYTAAMVGGNMYVFGGASPQGGFFNDLHMLDTDGDDWCWVYPTEVTGDAPAERMGHTVTVLGSDMYCGMRSARSAAIAVLTPTCHFCCCHVVRASSPHPGCVASRHPAICFDNIAFRENNRN